MLWFQPFIFLCGLFFKDFCCGMSPSVGWSLNFRSKDFGWHCQNWFALYYFQGISLLLFYTKKQLTEKSKDGKTICFYLSVNPTKANLNSVKLFPCSLKIKPILLSLQGLLGWASRGKLPTWKIKLRKKINKNWGKMWQNIGKTENLFKGALDKCNIIPHPPPNGFLSRAWMYNIMLSFRPTF